MSPKDFRTISHLEPKILTSLVSGCPCTYAPTYVRTYKNSLTLRGSTEKEEICYTVPKNGLNIEKRTYIEIIIRKQSIKA